MTRQEKYTINFNAEKKRIIKTAIELHYDKHVIAELKAAKSETELSRIMRTAREELLKS